MRRFLASIAVAAVLLWTSLASAACPQGTHPVIGPIRCTPTGCTGGEVRCVIGQGRERPVLYEHVEQKLWDWVPVTVDNIDLRRA